MLPSQNVLKRHIREKRRKKNLSWVADFNAITVTGTQKNKDLGFVC